MKLKKKVHPAVHDQSTEKMSSDPGIADRIGEGDRDAVASFLFENERAIRSRLRHKLGQRVRKLADTDDLWSTLLHRLDQYLRDHRIVIGSTGGFWALIWRVTDNAAREKGRRATRAKRIEHASATTALSTKPEHNASYLRKELYQQLRSLPLSDIDRQIIRFRLDGKTHDQIANTLNMSPQAVRKRWQRTRDVARKAFGESHED